MQRNRLQRCVFALLLVLLVLGSAVGMTAAAEKDTLVVGMELAYPPFEMTDTSGRPSGVSVDLAHELGKALGRKGSASSCPLRLSKNRLLNNDLIIDRSGVRDKTGSPAS